MIDRELDVLQEYDLNITSTGKVRGGILLIENDKRYILKECAKSEQRLNFEGQIHEMLKNEGSILSDYIIMNNENSYITKDSMQNSFIIKRWYDALECQFSDKDSMCNAVRLLGKFHRMTSGKIDIKDIVPDKSLIENYKRYNIELKRVRNFIRKKRHKSDFEIKLLSEFDSFYGKCEDTVKLLTESNYESMYQAAITKGEIIHGEFNHHNVMKNKKDGKDIIVNFDFAGVNLKIVDVYYFLRKIMEKNNWDVDLGLLLLESYEKENSISKDERKLLKILIMYPEKFRKIVNHYYNANKAWTHSKNMEKLILVHKQMEQREKFVNFL
ncbi:MAG: hypothetical protein E7270_05895 [Lachnospiraceae bacterium]|nr:hypothetical protein [Lachnospiraceae bacterium]MBQ4069273.1 hypothetical protein [Lachnospiraceae bacterium]